MNSGFVPVRRDALERWRDAFAEELSAYDLDPPLHHVKTTHDEIDAALRAALEQPGGERVFLVATGETHNGEETYTRHDGCPPPLCDFETLYAAPKPAQQPGDSGHSSPTSPQACPECGSDCNERDELIKSEREIERLDAENKALREALTFYANGDHYNTDPDECFDTVSGEGLNWLFSGIDESTTSIENGSVAKHALESTAPKQAQQTGVDSSVMVEALNAWASDLERGMQVCIAASSLRKIAAALAAPKPAQQKGCAA